MTQSPGTGSTPTSPTSPTSKASKRPGNASPRASGSRKLPPWSTVAALVIAVAAVVLAVFGWFRPPTGPGKFGDQATQDAKANICGATNTVRQAVGLSTNAANPVQGDPIGLIAVAANARLALYGGGGYLRERLAAQPATPKDLSNAVTTYANTLQELGINYLAGASSSDPVQQPLRDNLNSQVAELDNLCQ